MEGRNCYVNWPKFVDGSETGEVDFGRERRRHARGWDWAGFDGGGMKRPRRVPGLLKGRTYHPGWWMGRIYHPGWCLRRTYYPGWWLGRIYHPGWWLGRIYHPG